MSLDKKKKQVGSFTDYHQEIYDRALAIIQEDKVTYKLGTSQSSEAQILLDLIERACLDIIENRYVKIPVNKNDNRSNLRSSKKGSSNG